MIKEVRQFFHLSQEVLAGYLKISRGHLAMAETGRRTLPIAAHVRLAQLHAAIPQTVPIAKQAPKAELKAKAERRKQFMKEELHNCKCQLMRCERALLRLQQEQSRIGKVSASVQTLSASLAKEDLGLLHIINLEARKREQMADPDKQLRLEARMVGLKAMMRHLEKA